MRKNPPYRLMIRAMLLTGGTLLLAGCDNGGLSRTFGLTRDAPDEFAVTTRAPLSLPPDYNLRPPRPGAPRPQELSEQRQAQEILVPQTALNPPVAGSTSPGQNALLAQSGPDAPPDIRRRVDQDSRLDKPDDGFVDRLLYWRKSNPNSAIVDPVAEAQRVKANSALGQSQQNGTTPVIQEKRKGWFQSLFSWM
jgi:Protein of unknown function (DUF3035)